MFDLNDDETLLFSMNNLAKVPVFLDDNPEMQVGVMLVNPEYLPDFDACPPMKTHPKACPVHKKHVDHYSLPSSPRKTVKLEITVRPIV